MKRVMTDMPEAARMGAAARATIEKRFSPAAIGCRYRKRLAAIAYL